MRPRFEARGNGDDPRFPYRVLDTFTQETVAKYRRHDKAAARAQRLNHLYQTYGMQAIQLDARQEVR